MFLDGSSGRHVVNRFYERELGAVLLAFGNDK